MARPIVAPPILINSSLPLGNSRISSGFPKFLFPLFSWVTFLLGCLLTIAHISLSRNSDELTDEFVADVVGWSVGKIFLRLLISLPGLAGDLFRSGGS